jgi:hypothetical protein
MVARGWRRPAADSRRARGASGVQYALGMSLVLATTLSSLDAFEQQSSEALESRGNSIGTPDLDRPVETTTTTEAPIGGGDGTTTTTAPPTPPDSTVASATATTSSSGNKWTATVVISITDGGVPVHKATIDATWTQNPTGATTAVSCETQPNGTCTFALRNLPTLGNSGHVASVSFTVAAVTPDGGSTTNPGLTTSVSEPS